MKRVCQYFINNFTDSRDACPYEDECLTSLLLREKVARAERVTDEELVKSYLHKHLIHRKRSSFSLRLGHVLALTVTLTVIHYQNAATLPTGEGSLYTKMEDAQSTLHFSL